MKISIPSKTFLIGEYAALQGGTSLVACTQPTFSLSVDAANESELQGIVANSPAYNFYQHYLAAEKNHCICFADPYQGQGGFGASTAQFAALLSLKDYSSTAPVDIFTALDIYRYFAWNGKGYAPSGADLVAQLCGQISYLDSQQQYSMLWGFTDLEFLILKTKHKITTHQHLMNLAEFDSTGLNSIAESAATALSESDSQTFCAAINAYADELQLLKFCCEPTANLLRELRQNCPQALAAKGCGALGADVILVLFNKNDSFAITSWAAQHDLIAVATSKHICSGLTIMAEEEVI